MALLAGCAGAVTNHTPMATTDGSIAYSVHTVYGGLDGNREQANAVLDSEARRVCAGPYVQLAPPQSIAKRTAWGAGNGQHDLTWRIRCGRA